MKISILRDFIKELPGGPAQRTEEWKLARRNTIGGSEIAALMKLNPYASFKSVVANKLGISTFAGNIATMWGQLFEIHSRNILQKASVIEVIELPAVELFVKGHKFSPDGITIMQKNGEECIVLVEFKSPYMKVSLGVPVYYMPQLMSGLANFRLCKYALYMSTVFRKCTLEDWHYDNVFDTSFHKTGEFGNPVAMGLSLLTMKYTDKYVFGIEDYEETFLDEDRMETCIDVAVALDQMLDFGKCGTKGMYFLLKNIESGRIAVHDTPELLFEEIVEGAKCDSPGDLDEYFFRECEKCRRECKLRGRALVGYLPWKAMQIDIVEVLPDETEFTKIKKYLNCGLNVLHMINEAPDPQKKYIEVFDKSFNILSYSSSDANTCSAVSSSSSSAASSSDPDKISSNSESSSVSTSSSEESVF